MFPESKMAAYKHSMEYSALARPKYACFTGYSKLCAKSSSYFFPSQLKSLTSDIGGQLGLFVGISLLTVTEFLEFLIVLLMVCFNKRKAKLETLPKDNTEAADGYPAQVQLKSVGLTDNITMVSTG